MVSNMLEHIPNIRSKRELEQLCEVEDAQTGEVVRSTFTYIDDRNRAWFGQVGNVRKYELTVDDLKRYLRLVADDIIYPVATPTITAWTGSTSDYFVKRPKLLCLDNPDETKILPKLLIEEAEMLEFLRLHHHPHLVKYYGCILRNDRVAGIVLERHDIILQYRYEDDPRDLNISAFMADLRAGVAHLHSLQLAHNDLNPSNIAVNKQDKPVILDFGSCKRFGDQLNSGGTPGWIDEDYSTSASHHDEIAIEKVESWLIQQQEGRWCRK